MECLDCGNSNPRFFAVTRDDKNIITNVLCKNQLGRVVCNSTFILIEDEDNNMQLAASSEAAGQNSSQEQEPFCKQCLDTGFVSDVVTKQPKLCPLCQGVSRQTVTDVPVAEMEETTDEPELVSGADLGDEDDEGEENR